MNAPSIIILAILFILVGLAVWRGWSKGAPCECGCGCGGRCKKCGKITNEAIAKPRDFGRAGVSSPATVGGGTPTLPGNGTYQATNPVGGGTHHSSDRFAATFGRWI